MKGYIVEMRDSDGNDCTVYDVILIAESAEAAEALVLTHFDKQAESRGWESDGDRGWYYPCDCAEDSDGCDGHGGITLGDPEEFASLEAAAAEHKANRYYHCKYSF
jgi:hypothetical protein